MATRDARGEYQPDDPLEGARDWAKRGVPVVPVGADGGVLASSSSTADRQLRRWFAGLTPPDVGAFVSSCTFVALALDTEATGSARVDAVLRPFPAINVGRERVFVFHPASTIDEDALPLGLRVLPAGTLIPLPPSRGPDGRPVAWHRRGGLVTFPARLGWHPTTTR